MGIVRELTTLLNFQTDESGLNKFKEKGEKAVTGFSDTAKKVLAGVGTFFAAQFAVQSLRAFNDAVHTAHNAGIQIQQALTGGMDHEETMQGIFRIAQATGNEYTVVAQRFRSLALASREMNIDQNYALSAINNIQKSLSVGRVSASEQAGVFGQVEYAIRRGVLTQRAFGTLLLNAPRLVETLAESLGKTEAQLREMASEGELTSEVLIKALAKTNERLTADFEEVPRTMAEAMTYASNELIRIGEAIVTLTGGFSHLAEVIVWITDQIVYFGGKLVDMLGGQENAARILVATLKSIATVFALAFGPAAIKLLTAFAIKTAVAFAPFTAAVAVVGALILAFDDLTAWADGRESVFGWLVGPVENFQEQLDSIFAGIRSLGDAFSALWSGDVSGAFSNLRGGLTDIRQGILGMLPEGVGGFLENTLGNWFEAQMSIVASFGKLITGDFAGAWTSAKQAIEFVRGAINGILDPIVKIIEESRTWQWLLEQVQRLFDILNDYAFEPLLNSLRAVARVLAPIVNGIRTVGEWVGGRSEVVDDEGNVTQNSSRGAVGRGIDTISNLLPSRPSWLGGKTNRTQQDTDQETTKGAVERTVNNVINLLPSMPARDYGAMQIPPGAVANTNTTNNETNIENNVPITNNINITAPVSELDNINATVNEAVNRATNRMANDTAHGLTQAMARTEAAAA